MRRLTNPLFILILLQSLLCLPVIALELAGRMKPIPSIGACRSDAVQYHIPQIRYFIAHPFDFRPYPTQVAMGPGYHATLATLCRLTNQLDNPGLLILLHTVQFFLGIIYLIIIWRCCHSDTAPKPWQSFLVLLPAVLTPYSLNENNWPVTIMPSNLLAFLALLLYDHLYSGTVTASRRGGTLLAAGIVVAAALTVRQNVLWAMAPLALLGIRALRTREWNIQDWLMAVISVVPPVAVLWILYRIWGGLVPPEFQHTHTAGGYSAAAVLYPLALIACLTPFFAGYLLSDLRTAETKRAGAVLVLGAIIGLLLAVIGPTTFSFEAGRNGGLLWGFAHRLPAIADRSLLFLVLGPAGGLALAFLVVVAWQRGVQAFTVAFLAWLVICGLNNTAYHRYYEAMALLFFAFVCTRAPQPTRYAAVGPLLLAVAFVGLYLLQFR